MKMLYKSILAENFKIKKNLMFLTLCFFPLVITLMFAVLFLFIDTPNGNFWFHYAIDVNVFYTLLYPILLSFVAFVYVNLEIKNNCNKQLFCLPIKPYKIYLAKCTVLLYYYTISMIIAYVSYMFCIYMLGALVPEIGESINHHDSKHLIDLLFLKSYIILLPVIFLQFALSLAVPKVWLPCTVALFLYILGMGIYEKDYFFWLPNASMAKLVFRDLQYENIVIYDKVFFVSMAYSLLLLVAGYFTFKKSKSKIDS